MDLNQALENIKRFTDRFAEEEILCIRENRDAAIPALLNCVRGVVDNFDSIPENTEDMDDPVYSMFLLAEFKVHEAFEFFIRILELEQEKCEWLLGDIITEDMGSLIASVACAADVGRIKSVIENAEINSFQRSAALGALVIMYSEGKYSRTDLLAYLGYLLEYCADDIFLVTSVVYTCKNVCATDCYGRIRDLYKDSKVDPFVIGAKEFADELPVITEEEVLENLRKKSYTSTITDTVKSMHWWACFNKKPDEARDIPANIDKISRNAQCPCGSGKKYKKCCLKAEN